MRIYAASRGDVVKGALYMIGFVAVLDVAMVLFLQHVLHRTVTTTAQWPIGVVVLGVIAFTVRSYNEAANSWVQVTPKLLSWASGPKPVAVAQGLTPTGSVKLAEVTAAAVRLDEVQAKSGRKVITLRVHRLHVEVEGKPDLVLPIAAFESADAKVPAETLEHGRTQLLRVVEQLNANAKGFTVDTSVLGDLGDLTEAQTEAADAAVSEALAAQTEEKSQTSEILAAETDAEAEAAKSAVAEVEAESAPAELSAVEPVAVEPVAVEPEAESEIEAEAEIETEAPAAEVELVAEEPEIEPEPDAEAEADVEPVELIAAEPSADEDAEDEELEIVTDPAELEVVELVAEEPAAEEPAVVEESAAVEEPALAAEAEESKPTVIIPAASKAPAVESAAADSEAAAPAPAKPSVSS